VGSAEDGVIVVVHQDPGKYFPTRLLAGRGQRPDKGRTILIVEHDRFPPVSSCHYVVNGSLILGARCAVLVAYAHRIGRGKASQLLILSTDPYYYSSPNCAVSAEPMPGIPVYNRHLALVPTFY